MDVATLIGAISAIAAVFIPILLRHKRKSRSRISVKKIENPNDPDLYLAHVLYDKGFIPENELDSFEEIVRWLKEIQVENEEGRCNLKDYLLVAKVRNSICGILYCQYYPTSRLLFLSYMIIDNKIPEARRCLASRALLQYMADELRKNLTECEGVVFELEDPASARENRALTCRARIRHFRALARMQGITVKKLNIMYRQPRLSLWQNDYKEERLVLMYGRTHQPNLTVSVPKAEVEKVLGFLHKEIYWDHFEDDPSKCFEYRAYLQELYEREIRHLPEEIPVS